MSHKAMGASSPMCDLLVVRCSIIYRGGVTLSEVTPQKKKSTNTIFSREVPLPLSSPDHDPDIEPQARQKGLPQAV